MKLAYYDRNWAYLGNLSTEEANVWLSKWKWFSFCIRSHFPSIIVFVYCLSVDPHKNFIDSISIFVLSYSIVSVFFESAFRNGLVDLCGALNFQVYVGSICNNLNRKMCDILRCLGGRCWKISYKSNFIFWRMHN